MNTRSGISSVITGLIALVAVLGTAVFFLQSNSNILSGPETQQDKQKPLPSAQAPESVSNTLTANEEEQPTSQPLPIPPKTMTLEEECEKYGISQSVCSESTLLQKKRFEMPRQEQSEFIKISNAHIWVAHNNTSKSATP